MSISRILPLLIFSLFSLSLLAQEIQTEDFFQLDSEHFAVYNTIMDDSDNLYIAGAVTGEIDFDLGSGTFESPSTSFRDIFVAKYNSDNELQTAFFLDGNANFIVRGMDVDQDENIYITGFFNGTANFDLNASDAELTAFGSIQLFIAKYTPSGSLVWVHQIGETNFDQFPFDMIVHENNITLGMDYTGTVDFNPGAGSAIYSGNNSEAIVTFDLDGNFEKVEILFGDFIISDMHVDEDQNFYLSGGFKSTANLDLNGESNITAEGFGFDGFIAKYDASHNLLWSKNFGTDFFGSERARKLTVDSKNNVLCIFEGSHDYDLDGVSIEAEKSVLAVFDESGNLVDVSYQVDDNIFISDLWTLSDDRVVISGGFNDDTDFNPLDSEENVIVAEADKDNRFLLNLDNSYTLQSLTSIHATDIINLEVTIDSNDGIIAVTAFENENAELFGSDELVDSESEKNLVVERMVLAAVDNDGDGFNSDEDCDDGNANVNPSQAEEPYNGIDDDCNPMTLDDDLDQDGFAFANDCDDENADINPGQAEESYNGIDDDCDDATFDDDLDQDGFALADDCDDTDGEINPNAIEIPGNEVDENCDGIVETLSTTYELANATIDIYPNPAFEYVNIDIDGQLDYTVYLFSINGQELIKKINSTKIDIESLSAGTYILMVRDNSTRQYIVESLVKTEK